MIANITKIVWSLELFSCVCVWIGGGLLKYNHLRTYKVENNNNIQILGWERTSEVFMHCLVYLCAIMFFLFRILRWGGGAGDRAALAIWRSGLHLKSPFSLGPCSWGHCWHPHSWAFWLRPCHCPWALRVLWEGEARQASWRQGEDQMTVPASTKWEESIIYDQTPEKDTLAKCLQYLQVDPAPASWVPSWHQIPVALLCPHPVLAWQGRLLKPEEGQPPVDGDCVGWERLEAGGGARGDTIHQSCSLWGWGICFMLKLLISLS